MLITTLPMLALPAVLLPAWLMFAAGAALFVGGVVIFFGGRRRPGQGSGPDAQ